MTKEDIALQITRAIYKDYHNLESFRSYQCVRRYLLDLEMTDLLFMADQYGVQT